MADSPQHSKPAATNNLAALKVPPHSVDAEQAVLGGLMLDNTEWDNIADVLLPEDFYRAEHQLLPSSLAPWGASRDTMASVISALTS